MFTSLGNRTMQIAVTNPVRLSTQQDQPQRAATTEGHAAGQWAEVAGLGVKRAPGASHARVPNDL